MPLKSNPLRSALAEGRVQIGTDVFVYGKTDQNAPIDEPTLNHRFLGVEPDFYVNWQVTSDVTFAARYGVFFPHEDSFLAGTPPGKGESRQFLFLSVTYSF